MFQSESRSLHRAVIKRGIFLFSSSNLNLFFCLNEPGALHCAHGWTVPGCAELCSHIWEWLQSSVYQTSLRDWLYGWAEQHTISISQLQPSMEIRQVIQYYTDTVHAIIIPGSIIFFLELKRLSQSVYRSWGELLRLWKKQDVIIPTRHIRMLRQTPWRHLFPVSTCCEVKINRCLGSGNKTATVRFRKPRHCHIIKQWLEMVLESTDKWPADRGVRSEKAFCVVNIFCHLMWRTCLLSHAKQQSVSNVCVRAKWVHRMQSRVVP